MDRQQTDIIVKDLSKKMVFIVGPRQVGKTWLSKEIGKFFKNTTYLNYDRSEDRKIIKNESWLDTTDLLILDELHKMDGWKNYIKGVYDTRPDTLKIMVTGSARLDTFRQGGDSLAGRFFTHRLLPFTLSEIQESEYSGDIDRFITRGGFPEPFLAREERDADRWRAQYIDGIIRDDILDFTRISDLRSIKLVFELLRERVGSPVSFKSIAEDIAIAPNTVKKYIQILESLYIIFRVTPYHKNIARSLLKEPKIYFFDNGLVKGDEGIQFENFTALSLLKFVYGKTDREGKKHELNYLRTKDGREVDFCISKEDEAELMIEVKNRDSSLSKSLLYFSSKNSIKAVQLVKSLKRERREGEIEIRKGGKFLMELG